MNYALKITDKEAEIIAVVDSDYIVEPDFLKATVPYFKDEKVAIVQLPQDYRAFPETPLFEGMYYAYRYFFRIIMNSCNEHNAASFMGTMGLIRKRYLEDSGGWCEDVITEDSELGMRIHEKGYKSIYIDYPLGRGLMPFGYLAYKKQRFRWAFGNMQTIRRNIKILLSKNLTMLQKLCYAGANTIWFNNLLIPFIILLSGAVVDTFHRLGLAMVGPHAAFLFSRMIGLIYSLPRVTYVSVIKGVRAFLSFMSITFPMSTAWLICLVRPKGVFYRTPKSMDDKGIFGLLKEAHSELLITFISVVFSVIAFLKDKILIGGLLFINALIYSSSIWALIGFIRLRSMRLRKEDNKSYACKDRDNIPSLETSAT